MKVLVVGGGGREHTIVWKIAQSPKVDKIYCAPGNGGIAELAECIPVKATDIEGIVNVAKEKQVDLVMVAPDDPLVMGLVDALEKEAEYGRLYKEYLCSEIKKYALISMPKVNIEAFTASYSSMDVPQLKSLMESLRAQAGEVIPVSLQLRPLTEKKTDTKTMNNAFRI